MSQDELAHLIRQRALVKSATTRFNTYLSTFEDDPDILQLKNRLAKFECTYDEFSKIQFKIEEIDGSLQTDERDAFENNYFNSKTVADRLLIKYAPQLNSSSISTHQSNNQNIQIRLPAIDLPSFTGKYEEWLLFFDTFSTVIHDNRSLSAVQKFQYLRSSLKGDALSVISSLSLSNDNYEIAISLLKDRFHNEKVIVNNHVDAIFDLPAISKEGHIGLQQLLDNVIKHTRALTTLGLPVKHWDTLLIRIIRDKFDSVTRREWQNFVSSMEALPTMEDLETFLRRRCQFLESLSSNNNLKLGPPKIQRVAQRPRIHNKFNRNPNISANVATTKNYSCVLCKALHPIYRCNTFLKLSVPDKLKEVNRLKLCVNCLLGTHTLDNCKFGPCTKCASKHNSLLHVGNSTVLSNPRVEATTSTNLQPTVALINNHGCSLSSKVLLSTAFIRVHDCKGNSHELRVLLDSGSESNFISERAFALLGFKPIKINQPIVGIGRSITYTSKQVKLTIHSRINSYYKSLEFLVIPRIIDNLPAVKISLSNIQIPPNIKLADPKFNEPAPVDMLLGSGVFYELLCVGQFKLARNSPTFQKTKLGYVVAGNVQANLSNSPHSHTFLSHNLDQTLQKFWQLEEVLKAPMYNNEERACEEQFLETIQRMPGGRFKVKLPFNLKISNLGETKSLALKRFLSLERKLMKNTALKEQYSKFIREYQILNHMTLISESELQPNKHFYLPHHAVIRDSSVTTKLRVVFDGSAKSSTNLSLNDTLLKGPTIQDDLFSILLRFRSHNVVFTADIEKMYRQIRVDSDDANYQLILWRENESQPIQTFRLETVTYGTTSAPFQAIRCLKYLADEEQPQFPVASSVLSKDFYVDDLISGCDTAENALKLKNDLIRLLSKGGFHLRKWRSNDQNLACDTVDSNNVFSIDKRTTEKTLGILWNSREDVFQFSAHTFDKSSRVTKRSILSTIAQLFDPLGLIGPLITSAKILMQQLWQMKLQWDESVPINVHTHWIQYINQLSDLNKLKIPRKFRSQNCYDRIELHGFCDASQAAYGACIYIRATFNNAHSSYLLCSKSRVAPLKTVSLPRLELCAAVVLANLSDKVIHSLNIKFDSIHLWTDSTIVLSWINEPSNSWKVFVSNRVSEIQQLTDVTSWNHVPTHQNPADLISRGKTVSQLINSNLWFHGPNWLHENCESWPNSSNLGNAKIEEATLERVKQPMVCGVSTRNSYDIFDKYSNFGSLQRTLAWMLRFINNSRKTASKNSGPLKSKEIREATQVLVKLVQEQSFVDDIKHLRDNGQIHRKSNLKTLTPFLDENGLIRVGGRLKNATICNDQKHPWLLPANHKFTELIIRYLHEKYLHAGPQATLAHLRLQFWPLSGKTLTNKVLRKCVTCFKAKPIPMVQQMGDLPFNRVNMSSPFAVTGVDYAGPMIIKDSNRRGRVSSTKCYIAIFICFATKAIHLELVSNLTAEAFLSAFRRFVSRRGKIQHMYSDNATNFVAANNQIKELYKVLKSTDIQKRVNEYLTSECITWHFSPPRSPHHGGLYESAVKSVKYHLRRVVGNSLLTFEEYYTLLTQIESCLNSRPICPLSNDPNDLSALTPSHFLHCGSLNELDDPDIANTKLNRLSRWQYIQRLKFDFWKRWKKEYLTQLQQRFKWTTATTNVCQGQLVLLIEESLTPHRWVLGRIQEVHPGKDGLVRVVTVKTNSGAVKRAVQKVCALPTN